MQSSPFRMKVQKVHLKFIELWHIICYNSHWFVQWSFYVNQDTLRTKGLFVTMPAMCFPAVDEEGSLVR